MRNCVVVIGEMLKQIPSNQTEFIKALQWNREDASYKAPEETLQWDRSMQTLIKYIPEPTEDWEFNMLSIFTTKSVSVLKESFKNKK